MKKGDSITPQQAQDLALKVALKGEGFVSPNPLVGCVIVDRDHRFLSSGYHTRYGQPHAEVEALKNLSEEELRGATVYVTLEPCSHQGKTPACALTLIQKPIAKVVSALQDPNPLVAGQGHAILKEKGIAVEVDEEFGKRARLVSEQFLWHITHKIPFVALKTAVSLDGQIALKNGESQWITSESTRLAARRLRAHYDATLIGAGTFLKDNPYLDFRGTEFEGKKTNRVVIWDPKGGVEAELEGSNLLKSTPRENIIIVTSPRFDQAILRQLYNQGIYSLFVEGGSYVFSEFLKNRMFQKLYYFMAPSLLGDGLGWSHHLRLDKMDQKISLRLHEFEKIGDDLLLTIYPN